MFAIEANEDAFATYRHNLIDGPQSRFQHAWPEEWLSIGPHNIRTIRSAGDKYRKPLSQLRGSIDLVAGGPPCQGYSSLGRRNANDPRNQLVHDYLWFVERVQPRLILLENVSGMMAEFNPRAARSTARCRDSSGAAKLLEGLEKSYSIVVSGIFRASDYGVPQHRPRFITIGIRRSSLRNMVSQDKLTELAAQLLQETRLSFLKDVGLSNRSRVTCTQAISDLTTNSNHLVDYDAKRLFKRIVYKKPTTSYQKLMHGSLNGTTPNSLRLPNHQRETKLTYEKLLDLMNRGNIPAGKSLDRKILLEVGVRKHYFAILDKNKPSMTISTLPDDVLHYSEPRILTVRENARLQSFPDWFEFQGKYTTGGQKRKLECPRYTQVGNAVAPRFAEFLGRFLMQLDQKVK